jgi:hypothetical protein
VQKITIYPKNESQEVSIKTFLDELQADYHISIEDETSYLSTTVMKKRLAKARRQEENGEGKSIPLDFISE